MFNRTALKEGVPYVLVATPWCSPRKGFAGAIVQVEELTDWLTVLKKSPDNRPLNSRIFLHKHSVFRSLSKPERRLLDASS